MSGNAYKGGMGAMLCMRVKNHGKWKLQSRIEKRERNRVRGRIYDSNDENRIGKMKEGRSRDKVSVQYSIRNDVGTTV